MSWSFNMALTRRASAGLLALLAAWTAQARINVDTVPNRDSVQLTIYNSVDLTMVRETRYLTFRKGMSHLEFSWANTLIDPTSVEFKALDHADQVEVLDVSFPPRVTNLLEWRINSEFAGEVKVDIRYFTSGISWSADYVAEASKDEKLASLAGFVRVNNQSGEDYENSQIRLVVGVIKLVEDIAKLARPKDAPLLAPAAPAPAPQAPVTTTAPVVEALLSGAMSAADSKPREILTEGVSEYFLYTVEGRDTIPNGWSKRLPSFSARDVPLASYYKFEAEQWGENAERFYKFKNDKPSRLGDQPLPNGDVLAFRVASDDKLKAVVGQTGVKYIPVGDEVELDLGEDREVLVKPVLMDWRKQDLHFDKDGNVAGWTVVEQWQIEARNSRSIPVELDIRRNFEGDWTLQSAAPHEKVDATKVKFLLALKPGEKRTIHYQTATRLGLNATK